MTEKRNRFLEVLKTSVSNIWYIVAIVAAIAIVVFGIMKWNTVVGILGGFVSIMMPFIIGFFVAYLVKPLVNLIYKGTDFAKKGKLVKLKKLISVLISYIIVIGAIAVVVIYIFPEIKESAKELGNSIKEAYDYIIANESDIRKQFPFIDLDKIKVYISENLSGNIMNYSQIIFPYLYEFSSSLFAIVYNCIFGIVISIYIVLDSRNLVKSLRRVVYAVTPKGKEKSVWEIIKQCNHIFNGFLYGKAIDSLIIGILCFIAMTVLQLPYALLLSLIVGITNMIPYFGPFIGAVPGVLIYLIVDPKLALIYALMIFILQQFDGLYLGPKILGDLTGIKPLWVIFGITVGGAYFGVLGMFLGVPTVAVLRYLFELLIERKLRKKELSDV